MQSTINFALSNAFAKLQLSDAFRDQTIAYLWRPVTPPVAAATTPNIEKLNRQQLQRLEQMGGHDQKAFLAYVNGLDGNTFKSVSLVEHMEDFLHPPAAAPRSNQHPMPALPMPEEDEDEDLVEVSFHLRTYDVGVKTKRVYEFRGNAHVFVGMVGLNEFKGMLMPELE
jgi:hypothetical protein